MRFDFVLRRLRSLVSGALVAALAVSPFGVYYLAGQEDEAVGARFPAPIALVAVQDGVLKELGILHPLPVPGIVRLPPDSALSLPRAGTLRAATAFDILGPAPLAEALSNTLGINVPFWIRGEAPNVITAFSGVLESNLGENERAAIALWKRGLKQSFRGAGRRSVNGITRAYLLDARTIRVALRTPRLRVDPKPPARTKVDPRKVRVEVLRKAGATGAGTRAAALLRAKRFNVTRIADSAVETQPARTFVYYARNKAFGDAVAAAFGVRGIRAARLPRGVRTSADVLVLAGRDLLPRRT